MVDHHLKATSVEEEKAELLRLLLEEEGLHDAPGEVSADSIRVKWEPGKEIPLSFAQQRMWFLDRMDPGSCCYNQVVAFEIEGQVDTAFLRACLARIISRHEILRTAFPLVGDRPIQRLNDSEAGLDPASWFRCIETNEDADPLAWVNAPFTLSQPPLLRVCLERITPRKQNFYLCVHHIVADATSMAILIRELTTLFAAGIAGKEITLPRVNRQYVDYTLEQRKRLDAAEMDRLLTYWKQQLGDIPALLSLPYDYPRPKDGTFRPQSVKRLLPLELSKAVERLGRQQEATPFMTLCAAFMILMGRLSGSAQPVVGTPIVNRSYPGCQDMIGLFLNVLVLKADLAGNPSFSQWLHRVRETCLEGFAHSELPFDRLVEALAPERGLHYPPVFQVMFAYHGKRLEPGAVGETTWRWREQTRVTAVVDLVLTVENSDDGFVAWFEYNAALFHSATIHSFAEAFQNLLEVIVKDPARPMAEIPLWSWDPPKMDVPPACEPLHLQFARVAAMHPEKIAVEDAFEAMTYRQLQQRSSQIAACLTGLKPEASVGVHLERGVNTVATLLAIFNAGCAYVPLDPELPHARLAEMCREAGLVALVSDRPVGFDTGAATVWMLEALLQAERTDHPRLDEPSAQHCAYIIFTSGSTGGPKGVRIRHGALAHFMEAMKTEPGLSADDKIPAVTTLSFDIAALELFLPLLVGASVYVVDRHTAMEGRRLAASIEKLGSKVMQATPATWKMLLDAGWQGTPGFRVLCGGEALPKALAQRLREKHFEVWNLYGPTEVTIWSTLKKVGDEEPGSVVEIGKPLPGLTAYVLDTLGHFQRQPPGGIGELYLGGAGLARDYLNRPRLTAERFLPDPFGWIPGARLFRTGDLVRRTHRGGLAFLGRLDHQLKLRGFRIEPAEIEEALCGHQQVAQACVHLLQHGGMGPMLVAHFVPVTAAAGFDPRAHLEHLLPSYMVPSLYISHKQFPQNANGKTDRKALHASAVAGLTKPLARVGTSTQTEALMIEIWCDLLQVESIHRDTNFFHIGGHSLSAAGLQARVFESFGLDLPMRRIFETPTPAGLATWVDQALAEDLPMGPPLTHQEHMGDNNPLSFGQQRLWFLERFEGGSAAYNMSGAFELEGELDFVALTRSLAAIVDRHEILRTTFPMKGDVPQQLIAETLEPTLERVDLSGCADKESQIESHLEKESRFPFNPETGPLLRFVLLDLGSERHVLVATMHHIVWDGWSIGIFIQEFSVLYESFSKNSEPSIPALPLQYRDFARWEQARLEGATMAAQLDYWQQQLVHAPPVLNLPWDRPRPAVQSFRGAALTFEIDENLTTALKQLGRKHGTTLFMTLHAALNILLSRFSGQTDISIGIPVANRGDRRLESLIGFFTNTLVMRTKFSDNPSFKELLIRVRQTALEAYANRDLPFERLVEALKPERNLSFTPFFQVLFALQNHPDKPLQISGLNIRRRPKMVATSKFDLSLYVVENDTELTGTFEFGTDLFNQATIQRMADHFVRILNEVVRFPERPLAEIAGVSKHEASWLLEKLNDTGREVIGKTVQSLIADQIAKTPEAIAIEFGQVQLTYQELQQATNRLAAQLQQRGAGPEKRVAVFLPPGPSLVVALLGVLKSGAAYVPLDPGFPPERIATMLDDCSPLVILHGAKAPPVNQGAIPCLDIHTMVPCENEPEPLVHELTAEHSAYVIYTSGSTGKPKGVVISHGALINFLTDMADRIPLKEGDGWLSVTTVSFDIAALELFLPLMGGGRVVLATSDQAASGKGIQQLLETHGCTFMQATPATWRLWVDSQPTGHPGLHMLCGGEALSGKLADQLQQRGADLINLYGPTETTIWSTLEQVSESNDGWMPPSIGLPLANTTAHVLDAHLHLAPQGVAGELYLGGAGLARGYFRMPARTAVLFIPNPFATTPGERLYRTGDRVRRLEDGRLVYLGRIDSQLKIRGFRIEPGDIEHQLMGYGAVANTAIVAQDAFDGGKRLLAYVVPTKRDGNDALLEEQLDQWRCVWNDTYDTTRDDFAPEFNTGGWKDSLTGRQIPEGDMREWVDHTVGRILALKPQHILELGCGTGLLMDRLAPNCQSYLGTDFSEAALASAKRLITYQSSDRVRLQHQAADDFSQIPRHHFDVMVLNSVAQYFPALDYLKKVLHQAINTVAPGGYLFIGDLRNLRLAEPFHATVEAAHAPATMSVSRWRKRVRKRMQAEEELLIDPDFFLQLQKDMPQISRVLVQLKQGESANEMVHFRYDVVLQVGGQPPQTVEAREALWNQQVWTPEHVSQVLAERYPDAFVLRNIPNKRLDHAAALEAFLEPNALSNQGAFQTLAAVNRSPLAVQRGSVDPDQFRDLNKDYFVQITWSGRGYDMCFDAVFLRRDPARILPQITIPAPAQPYGVMANAPMQGRLEKGLITQYRQFLEQRLPHYMQPSEYVILDALPMTPNGKVDRNNLPEPADLGLAEQRFIAPRGEIEKKIADIWSAVLGIAKVGVHSNFFELGGHSLAAAGVHNRLKTSFGLDIAMVDLFRYPTVAALAELIRLKQEVRIEPVASSSSQKPMEPIAIIAVNGRFPGAGDIETYWKNLCEGIESITHFSDKEVAASLTDKGFVDHPRFVKAKGEIRDMQLFDAAFFGYSPREAEILDPQARMFTEAAWETLETAGYDPGIYPGRIGVYAGSSISTYLISNLLPNRRLLNALSEFQAMVFNDKEYVSTSVSYKLNLKGPSMTVSTACSTSLVAVQLACRAIEQGQCDMALAGGVSLQPFERKGYFYEEGGINSPDGHCRAFDESAGGTVFSSGLGVVLLKRLKDAVADGDQMLAVVRGVATNNDGSAKVGYTAPSVDGQATVIRDAHALAGVTPDRIGYVEAHGTGTKVGDPIEITALTHAFQGESGNHCAVGSVKTNIGHLDTAAGIAGLIKTTLILKHGYIPPSLNFEKPNARIDFENSPFFVNHVGRPWERQGKRLAAVSAFGVGGTNAHAVLEQAPPRATSGAARAHQLFVLSARTEKALKRMKSNLLRHLRNHPGLHPADVAFTLQVGRAPFNHRAAVVCRDLQEFQAALSGKTALRTKHLDGTRPSPVFLFPGQGSQYPQMGRAIYATEPVFRNCFDRCCEILKTDTGFDLRELLFVDGAASPDLALSDTQVTQPLLFAFEYALAELWQSWGVKPEALLGHSVGEYTAACLAGVFSLKDGLRLIAARGKLIQSLPQGQMMAVSMSPEALAPHLGAELYLAVVNGPEQCVVSGPSAPLNSLKEVLNGLAVPTKILQTSHAFHSRMMDPVLAPFQALVKTVALQPPTIPILSNVTGDWLTAAEATDPSYWTEHLRGTVQFAANLEVLLKDADYLFLEVGPGNTLARIAASHPHKNPARTVLPSLPHARENTPDDAFLLNSLGRLWLSGVSVNWERFHLGYFRRREALPTYPFERKKFWIDPPALEDAVPTTSAPVVKQVAAPSAPVRVAAVDDMLFKMKWRQAAPITDFTPASGRRVLVIVDEYGLGQSLAENLRNLGAEVTLAALAGTDIPGDADILELPRNDGEAFEDLLEAQLGDEAPDLVLHCACWTRTSQSERLLEDGFYSLLFLGRALGRMELIDPCRLVVLGNGILTTDGKAGRFPEKAAVLGPIQVIPQEFPDMKCRLVDVPFMDRKSKGFNNLLERLTEEVWADQAPTQIALQDDMRLEPKLVSGTEETAAFQAVELRPNATVLITGGLGGIGLTLAEFFAEHVQAKLVLTTRRAFPAEAQWEDPQHVATWAEELQAVRRLRDWGAEVLVLQADSANRAEMTAAFEQIQEAFGHLHGVIHAAGVPGGGMIQLKTREAAQQVMAPKVIGGRILADLTRDMELDFFVLCSSLAGSLGGFGQIDYAAANAFLSALAEALCEQGVPAISIEWDAWRETGMAVKAALEMDQRSEPEVVIDPDNAPEEKRRSAAHPLFDYAYESADGSEQIYVSRFRISDDWPLEEHRIAGIATISGTTYLEMAHAAYANEVGELPMALSDIFFLQPLMVQPEEEKEVQTILTRDRDGARFSIKSRDQEQGSWLLHAQGRLALAEEQFDPPPAMEALLQRDMGARVNVRKETYFSHGLVQTGPRWKNVDWVQVNHREGLAKMTLAPNFESDLAHYRLHPALLDTATSFHAAIFMQEGESYLPFFYKKLVYRRPMGPGIYSYSQVSSEKGRGENALTMDLLILNQEGDVCVEVEGFTLKKLDPSKFSNQGLEATPENYHLITGKTGNASALSWQPGARRAPEPGEVEIEVAATGLNFREVLLSMGLFPQDPNEPYRYGLECSGTVTAIGDGIENLAIGQAVMALGLSCFSRFITLPRAQVIAKPDGLTMAQAAAVPLAYMTAYHGLVNLGHLQEGERVLIHSATGGVGLAAVDVARARGAEIFATAGNDEKRAFLKSLGIEHVMNSRSLDFAEEIMTVTDGGGVDVVLNSLAGEFLSKSVSVLGRYGRFLEIGVRDIYNNTPLGLAPFEKNLSFHSYVVAPDLPRFQETFEAIGRHFDRGDFQPAPQRVFPFSRAADAFQYMSKTVHMGKIVISHEEKDTLAWQGQALVPAGTGSWQTELENMGLSNAEGLQAFTQILANPSPRVLVSTYDFEARKNHPSLFGLEMPTASSGTSPRPDLDVPYVAPRNPNEEQIAEIWESILGISNIGIHDNFFELGANSLTATQLHMRVQTELQTELSIEVFFENPTIAGLAERLETTLEEPVDEDDLDRILSEIDELSEEEAERRLNLEEEVR